MGSVPPLLSFLLMIVSGWVHWHQLLVIEFLQAENGLLKERLRGKRIRIDLADLGRPDGCKNGRAECDGYEPAFGLCRRLPSHTQRKFGHR